MQVRHAWLWQQNIPWCILTTVHAALQVLIATPGVTLAVFIQRHAVPPANGSLQSSEVHICL